MAATYETSLAPTFVTFLQAGETEIVAFDAGSGANRVLRVAVFWRDRTQTTSGITYNDVAMTALGPKVTDTAQGILSGRLYELAGPASGTNNIAVTMESNPVTDSAGVIVAWVGNAVNQSTPSDGYITNAGGGTTANQVSSVTITSATGDRAVVFFGVLCGDEADRTAAESNYTERQEGPAGIYRVNFGDADGVASVAASATWNNSGGIQLNWVALGLNTNDAGGGNDLSVSLQEAQIGGSIF